MPFAKRSGTNSQISSKLREKRKKIKIENNVISINTCIGKCPYIVYFKESFSIKHYQILI